MYGIGHRPHPRPAPETEGPHSRPIKSKPGKPDQLADHLKGAEDRQEALIDEGIEESFPASDPLSPKHIT